MNQTWWVSKNELNDEQTEVIALPLDGSHLVIGPPGSGKTNLLLLRANYATLAGHPNIAVIVFTRTLQEFIISGASQYDFPASKVMTCIGWQSSLIREYGGTVPQADDFQSRRAIQAEMLRELIDRNGLKDLYDLILLDEAQDYTPAEIEMFDRLSRHLFVVADSRQKIYDTDDPFDAIKSRVDSVHELRFHFRNGIQICRLADAIGKDRDGYKPLEGTSNYDEESRPSVVSEHRCKDIDDQISKIFEALQLQLTAYPEELLGICCPRNSEVDAVWNAIRESEFGDIAVLQKSGEHAKFSPEIRICVSTLHAAKGLEFRALHLAGAEHIKSFRQYQKNVAYTSVTRAKTSLTIYYSENLPGYLEGALAKLQPLPDLPGLDDVFGGSGRN